MLWIDLIFIASHRKNFFFQMRLQEKLCWVYWSFCFANKTFYDVITNLLALFKHIFFSRVCLSRQLCSYKAGKTIRSTVRWIFSFAKQNVLLIKHSIDSEHFSCRQQNFFFRECIRRKRRVQRLLLIDFPEPLANLLRGFAKTFRRRGSLNRRK